jgi:hypothetical protein
MKTKLCSRGCGPAKPLSAFPKNATKKDGHDSECLRCKHARMNTAEARLAARLRLIARKYGLTKEQYEALALKQCNLCAICGEPEKKTNEFGEPLPLAVDHDHTTGKVRGLLCGPCNKGIGLLGDTEDRLHRAWLYLVWNGP